VELRQLRYFVELAEQLHFRKAATQLCITQPALSQQIRLLEEELGVDLFVRSRRVIQRKVDLTDAGLVLLREARLVLQQSQRAMELTRQVGKHGVVRMGVFKTLLRSRIIDVMNVLTQRVPETDIKLIELPSYLSVQQALLDNTLDLGLTILPLRYPQLSAVSFTKGNMAILLAAAHPLASQHQLTLAQLRHETWVEIPAPLNPVYESVNQLCQELGYQRWVVQEVGSLELLADLVQLGKGIGLIPSHFNVSHLPGLVAVPLVNEQASPYPQLELEHVVAFLTTQTSPVINALGPPLAP
jgi:DNA-binding transcriptional LysR family regulator